MTDAPHPTGTTTAEPRGLRELLRLQEADLALDRLNARRSVLAGGAEVAAARSRAFDLEARHGQIRLSLDDVTREQGRLEHDIDSMTRKRRDEEKRLYDGSVANARELQSIRAEIENIANRTTRMEDHLLELMEQREGLESDAAAAEGELIEARRALDEMMVGAKDELGDIEAAAEAQGRLRAAILPAIDPDLLTLYEDMRRQKKGVGVAELRDGVCQGCHQKLSPMELDRMRRSSAVRRCEYCRRILVPA